MLGLSCSEACEIFPDSGSNPCLLHPQADSLPLGQPEKPQIHTLNASHLREGALTWPVSLPTLSPLDPSWHHPRYCPALRLLCEIQSCRKDKITLFHLTPNFIPTARVRELRVRTGSRWDQWNGRDAGNVELRQIPVSQHYWTQEALYVAQKACWSSLGEEAAWNQPLCSPSERCRKSPLLTILDPQEEWMILPINSLLFSLCQLEWVSGPSPLLDLRVGIFNRFCSFRAVFHFCFALEQFWVHRKIERKIQRFPIYPLPAPNATYTYIASCIISRVYH